MTGGSSKEHRTNKPPLSGKTVGKVKRGCHMSYQLPESSSLKSILAEQSMHHLVKYSKSGNVPEGFGRTEIQVTQGDRNFQKRPDCTGVTGKEQ